ncbi:rho GTPase-activating protein 27-like isoform X1 [Neocloeon triangulifer]|uniref:rho GTPase-activating protein 27-like isoform X1 n=1 Tax=Neocloeon triangulifer TaxID=2078957 RepID=UPI00286F8DBF|nr:rho GTPase-activating protein 27-like isoform X1 [Neocloeon triangulifer]
MQSGEVCVRVLYNFDYTTKDGRLVSIRQSEKLLLLKRTNKDWWQVRRDADTKPFYVPAAYVRQIPPAFIPVPKHEYTNMPAGPACCHEERRQLTSVLRNELITGNYNLRADKQLFNQHVCPAADKEPATGVRRNYSVVGPTGKKRPVPSPRQLSKSLETLAEEIQFRPWTQHDKSCEQTSDYNTPSPDYLDSPCCEQDMFWKKINLQSSAGDNSVQRSSSFKFRSFRRNNNVQPPAQFEDSSDSVASRSLESLVDSGAEACSSSSYEWDKSPGEDNLAEVMLRVSIPHAALAFKNQTYQSTDDEDSDVDDGATVVRTRPRSSSDTGLTQEQSKKESAHLSRSESHRVFNKEQPKPLIALKRNPKLVGCRRRPALLCLPTKSSSLEDDDDYLYDETPRGRKRPPKTPPSPAPHEKPLRVLPGGWAEFYCSDAGGQGRLYYFHAITGLKSWKPPRTKRIGYDGNVSDKSDGELRSGKRSPKEGTKSRSPSPAPSDLVLPPGWEEHYDRDEHQAFFIHKPTGAKWLSPSDSEGRVYFFAENSNDSTWSLPKTPAAPKGSPPLPGSASPPKTSTPLPRVAPQGVPPVFKRLELQLQQTADESSPTDENDTPGLYRPRKNMGPCLLPPLPNSRTAKSQSMHVPDIKTPMTDCSVDTSGPWASLENTGVTILKEGLVSRTKVMESGKKVKKNWAQGWALLTDDCMYFFKDEKSFKLMRNDSIGHPELCIRLLNSTFGEADKSMSSKKNAFIIGNSTTQLLCQEDQIREQDSWFNKISVAKKSLPENHLNTAPRVPVISREASPNPPATQNHRMGSASPEIHKSNSLNRSKSVKMKKDVAESNEDLTSQDSQKNIRAGLKKFFKRRPTMETLVKKGIWKDEPAFGSTLKKLCEDRSPGPNPKIPKFVYECIKAIEKKPENLKTDGIYRASGNLSQVQKIRLQVDQNNLEILDQEEEVHVLTGALKLFFRELKEPLIPFDAFQKSLFASSVGDKLERSRLFREIIQNLPKENHDTLKFLLEHLLRVVANQIFNRMDIGNLSIVFGPTLMWPEQESLDCMAVDLMRQNNVIVCLLHEFDSIFN